MHLVLESENGERVSVPIDPEEFDFTDEDDDEEYEHRHGEEEVEDEEGRSHFTAVDNIAPPIVDVGGGNDATLLRAEDGAAAVDSDARRDLTPTPAAPTGESVSVGAEGGVKCGRGAGSEPEVGVATRLVNSCASNDGESFIVWVFFYRVVLFNLFCNCLLLWIARVTIFDRCFYRDELILKEVLNYLGEHFTRTRTVES